MRHFNKTLQMYYYDVDDLEEILKGIAERNKIKITGNKKSKYLDLCMSLDIEVTSFYKIIKIKKGKKMRDKVALMYVWQFAIHDDALGETFVFIGRTWDEFRTLMKIIGGDFFKKLIGRKSTVHIPVYIHNAGFEFAFLCNEIPITEVFATKASTPLYFRSGYFEFRCSYLLSGVALKALETKKFVKLEGDLDFSKLRHSKTKLTDKEIAYCMADVLVLCEYINGKREQDGSIGEMQRTKTGYARKLMRETTMGMEYFSQKKSDYIKENLIPLGFHSATELLVQTEAFQGGHTASCPFYTRKHIREQVRCYDITSSYPTVMCCSDHFPIKLDFFKEKMGEKEYEDLLDRGKAIVSHVRFYNVRPKHSFDCWIPNAHVSDIEELYVEEDGKKKRVHEVVENGKFVSFPGWIEMYLCDVDYEIYKDFYDWDKAEFDNCFVYMTGYLPKSVIECILKLYSDKTELKDLTSEDGHIEMLYALAKELLNSLYGMAIMSPIRPEILYDSRHNEWHTRKPKNVEDYVEAVIKYNKNLSQGKISTVFVWGLYTASLARRNLEYAVLQAGRRGIWLYCDTDSVYILNDKQGSKEFREWIDLYNAHIEEEMFEMCDHYGFDRSIWRPKNCKGKEKPLGYYTIDGDYVEAKFLGAKRYIKSHDGSDLTITVAGLGKEAGAKYLLEEFGSVENAIDHFDDCLEVPAEKTGKLTHTLIREEKRGVMTDYLGEECEYVAKGGIHLSPASFSLSLDEIYIDYILNIQQEEY